MAVETDAFRSKALSQASMCCGFEPSGHQNFAAENVSQHHHGRGSRQFRQVPDGLGQPRRTLYPGALDGAKSGAGRDAVHKHDRLSGEQVEQHSTVELAGHAALGGQAAFVVAGDEQRFATFGTEGAAMRAIGRRPAATSSADSARQSAE